MKKQAKKPGEPEATPARNVLTVGWTNITKLWVVGQDNMANAVSMPREYFPTISKFSKRNRPGAARIQFIKGNHAFYNGAKPKRE